MRYLKTLSLQIRRSIRSRDNPARNVTVVATLCLVPPFAERQSGRVKGGVKGDHGGGVKGDQ
jgi:hypothetical protein